MKKITLTDLVGVKHPIIMAPMFLVTNTEMMIEALNSGIAACVPALNYRTNNELRTAIKKIRANTSSTGLGVNLIVNKSNLKIEQQLHTCVQLGVDFIITSLGNPKKVIDICKTRSIKVFCDVIEETHAIKVENLGADALIAVNKDAGGHAGKLSSQELFNVISDCCSLPIISAGGIGTKEGVRKTLSIGFSGLSIGSPFIACKEAHISEEYKEACVTYGKKDIVLTNKISGTPCTVINTPYVQEVGTKQNWIESLLSKNKRLRKWIKMLTFLKGMKTVEKAAFSSTYRTVWCAGPSIEHTKKILHVKEIVSNLINRC